MKLKIRILKVLQSPDSFEYTAIGFDGSLIERLTLNGSEVISRLASVYKNVTHDCIYIEFGIWTPYESEF